MFLIEDILGRVAPALGIDPPSCASATSTSPARPRPTGSRCGCRAHARHLGAAARRERLRRAARRGSPSSTPSTRDVKRGARDHAGQVRHLVQLHRLQPGRRPRARLQGRLGADQPRRHRDGAGAAHEDAAGRGHRPRAVELDAVRLAPTRTDKVPNTSATAASSGADLNGGAVKNACEQIRDRMAAVAGAHARRRRARRAIRRRAG